MSVEEVRPEAPAKRNFTGWIALAVLFSVLTYVSISSSVKAKPAPESYLQQNVALRAVAANVEIVERAPDFAVRQEDKKTQVEAIRAQLDNPISDIVSEAEKTPAAARIYAAMRTEQGKDIPANILRVLRESKDPLDQTYLQIYGQPKLTREESQRLALELPERPFVNKLAAVHALEKGGSTLARRDRMSPVPAYLGMVAGFLGFGTIATGMLAWAVYLVGRRNGRFKPLGHPIGRVTLPDADRLAILAAQILGAYLVLSVVSGLALGSAAKRFGSALGLGLSVGIVLITLLIAAVPVDGKRITLASLGLHRERLGKNVLWGFAGFFAEVPISLIMIGVGTVLFRFLPPPSHPATQTLTEGRGFELVATALGAAILAPIWEEILFRGILFPALGRVSASIVSGAIFSSLLFGIIHPQGPILVLALASVGGMSCALAYQTKSIVPSIVMHMAHNSAIVVLALLIA